MENITSLFAVLTGFLLRLAIPILGTVILVYLLRKLDAHWQTEAERTPIAFEKVECWNIKGGSEEQHQHGATPSSLPCWQVHRQPNGYLHEACLTCEVFTAAPIPALPMKPRRM